MEKGKDMMQVPEPSSTLRPDEQRSAAAQRGSSSSALALAVRVYQGLRELKRAVTFALTPGTVDSFMLETVEGVRMQILQDIDAAVKAIAHGGKGKRALDIFYDAAFQSMLQTSDDMRSKTPADVLHRVDWQLDEIMKSLHQGIFEEILAGDDVNGPGGPETAHENGTPESPPLDDLGLRTLTLTMTPPVYHQIEALARRKGKTISETVRDALALETWFHDVRDAGDHVLFEHQGKLRELAKV